MQNKQKSGDNQSLRENNSEANKMEVEGEEK